MLDTDTKRRIDTARDILVGKVPDPKSQVEQITIALIYKFMDDMDAESEEFGGKRKFFAREFARYGWAKLMHVGLGGHETLNLYAEAIAKMPENPGIPPLFRDIFKNAYLPYRDPETLKMFLKVIDEFNYDHSEHLGDAFEYLLSVLGSQGDAGQFRTPRHIIDFMVAIIDPKKTETVLDPAGGTAGFLISSYKRILKANTDKKGNSTLTPDEKGRLAQNFKGYDISPDMVRLSLVNLYLHGFADPHFYEYDTLTSEERWNEFADVFLANPPFMSPKGGIKPHKRFSVQSKRSEVLFVDYMAEHLTPSGRAGIIVPEGIIFQSQTAYKQLRKMLVENFLIAVVSLPAGVFNPYSGVKTSILILDKSLARKTNTIAFFKIVNDGFVLGAQHLEIDKNDLPAAAEFLKSYLQSIRSPSSTKSILSTLSTPNALIVAKEKIAANGDYNLSGERYRENGSSASDKWPMVELGKFARLINGRAYKQEELLNEGPTPVLRVGNFFSNRGWYYSDLELDEEKYCNTGDLLYAWSASFGPRIWEGPRAIYHYHIWKIETTDAIDKKFLFHLLQADSEKIKSEGNGIAMVHTTKGDMEQRKFPLPPLEAQKEIVVEIEGYQKIINGARAVLENYRPHIPIHPNWPMVQVGEACIVNPRKSELADLDGATVVSFVPMSDIGENTMFFEPKETKRLDEVTASYTYFKDGDVLLAKVTPCFENGKAGIVRGLNNSIGFGSSEFYVLRPTDSVLPAWIFVCVATPSFRAWATLQMTGTGGLQRVPRAAVEGYKILLPPLATQQAIVTEIEAEQALVNANRELIARFEKKIQATLARVWGEDEPAPAEV